MTKGIIILILFTLFLSCENNKKTKHTTEIFKPVNNRVKVDYNESWNKIFLKRTESDEILYKHFYSIYKDDSLIDKYKKNIHELLQYQRDTTKSRTSPFEEWLKHKLLNSEYKQIYFAHSSYGCSPIQNFLYVEIERENNSSYYKFKNDDSKPSFFTLNIKKGLLGNLFDTLVEYENEKAINERPLPGLIGEGKTPSTVIKFEKNYITTTKFLRFANYRYEQTAFLYSRIDSMIYRMETGQDLDSIRLIHKRYMDSVYLLE